MEQAAHLIVYYCGLRLLVGARGVSRADAMTKIVETPDYLAYMGVRRLYQVFGKLYAEQIDRKGPTLEQFVVLRTLKGGKEFNQTRLVRLSGIDRSTLSAMKPALIASGYIKIGKNENDTREVLISLTAEGQKAVRTAEWHYARAEKKFHEILIEDRMGPVFDKLKAAAALPDHRVDEPH